VIGGDRLPDGGERLAGILEESNMLMIISKIALMFEFEKTEKRWILSFKVSLGLA
jgi:hypothetical protein